MKAFDKLTKKSLWKLRKEIVLNSCMLGHYENTFGYDPNSMYTFFDGYYDYLWELAEEDGKDLTHEQVIKNYDNANNLWGWYNCFDDFSWVKYKAMEE